MQPQVFDSYAKTYDEHFTNTLIGKAQRKQVYKHLNNNGYFLNKSILEINCGTGEDAIWLADQGARVLATDISADMLKVAADKSKGSSIQFQQLSSQEIASLYPNNYEWIFSNFGGLNCLSPQELDQFKNGCEKLQTSEDRIGFVVMGTKCWWERLYFKWKKDITKSKRRLNPNGADTVIQNNHFKTYYYNPKQIRTLFKENYDHIATKPVGLFVPPSYLEPYFTKRKGLFWFLRVLDKWFGNLSFLANYADHYLIVFEKK